VLCVPALICPQVAANATTNGPSPGSVKRDHAAPVLDMAPTYAVVPGELLLEVNGCIAFSFSLF
jgi:hypothetical protein